MWYHGSDKLFEVLRPGSTITQNKDLAIAFFPPAHLADD